MNAMSRHSLFSLAVIAAAVATAGCSDFLRQDRSPVTLVIDRLEGSSGATGEFAGTLQSDVITVVDDVPTVFSDNGRVTMRLVMTDVFESPTAVNAVTINRYRVSFRRSDGRNTWPFASWPASAGWCCWAGSPTACFN